MKKVVFLLLSVVLVISLFAIPAYAADGNATIEVTADKNEVHPGDTITYTFTLKHTSSIGVSGVEFAVGGFPSGIIRGNYEFDQAAKDVFKGLNGQGGPAFNSQNSRYVFTAASGVTTTEIKLMTLTCTVEATAKVNEAFVPAVSGLAAVGGDNQEMAATPSTDGASVTVTHTEEAHHSFNTEPDKTLAATCTAEGKKIWKCTIAGCSGTKEETIPKSEHNWQAVQWGWGDPDNPTATVTCTGVGGAASHTDTATVKVTIGDTTATCSKAGNTTYKGSAVFNEYNNGKPVTNEYKVSDAALGHEWEKTGAFTWDTTTDPQNATAKFTIKCTRENCDGDGTEGSSYHTAGYTTEATVTHTAPVEPRCGADGSIEYTASATVYGVTYTEKKTVDLPALGHRWAAAGEWTWEGNNTVYGDKAPTAKVKVMCLNKGQCDSQYDTNGLVIDAEVTPDDTHSTAPTCTKGGAMTFNATAVTTGHFNGTEKKAETFNSSTTETYTALGHEFAEKAVFTWPEKAGDDNKGTPAGVTATLACTRDNCPVANKTIKGTVTVTNGTTANKAPTYSADGINYWNATATFDDGKGGTVTKEDVDHPYTIAKLEPEAIAPTTQKPNDVTVEDAPAAEDIQTQVQNALQGNASGLDAKLAAELEKLGESTTGDMQVETKLVVNPKQNTTVDPGTDAGTKLAAAYDIHIDVTVTGGGLTQPLTGSIEQTEEPISFSVPKPEGGPIYIVERYHGGKWQPIGFTLADSSITFSSNLFSEFAILSSSDLKYADIEPIPDQTYTGSEIKPAVKVTINGGTELEEGTDYTVEYANNTNVGTASVTIKAVAGGDYAGSQTVYFKIVEKAAAGSSGSGSGSGTKTAPATGDETPVALYAGILALSAAALAVVCFRRKKSH